MESHRKSRELTLDELTQLANAKGSGAFSEQEILAANRRHDRYYGWSFEWPGIYANALRLPETTVGPLGW